MRPQSPFYTISQEDKEHLVQSILSDPQEFIQEFQKSILRIDKYKDELSTLPTKEDRLRRVSEILKEE